MILRKFQWTILLSLHLLTIVTAQNARSYDENEWIPITPSNPAASTKKAQGRVLNLETPSQNFFPETEYVAKRPQPQQYIQETSFQKAPNARQSKPAQPYKFEAVVPLQPPQYIPQNQYIQQQVQPQFIQSVQQLPYVQTLQQVQQVPPVRPVQEQTLSQQLVAPPQSTQNYYDANKAQISDLLNNSYQTLINRELLGAIQNQNINQIQLTTTTTKPKEEKESVQLLYVPLENLRGNQVVTQQTPRVPKQQPEAPRRQKPVSRSQNHKQNQLTGIQDDFIRQALAAHKLQEQFKLEEPVLVQSTTAQPPKKRKANQPPLSVYMEKEGPADVKDVLDVLKHAKSISVQDTVGPDSPKVFVGPSSIEPEGYAKFPLPYLSTVQGNRIERKVEQLPFFVAPLSYKTPDGYSKIPLPSPHVGSVVVSTKEQLHEKHSELRQPQTAQNQIVQDFDVKQPFPDYNRPQANPYLISQNNPQANQESLLGFGNEFLGGYPNNAPNYEVSSSKGFVDDYQDNSKENVDQPNYQDTPSKDYPNYQLGLKDNNQYYETTPSYKPEGKTNVRSNYQIPDTPNYQLGLKDNTQYYETTPSYKPEAKTNVRSNYQIPDYQANDQNSKELIRDYDIPSLPVESKTSFTPTNYQIEQKPQINQFSSLAPSYVTPKTPADVYTLSNEPIRQTTTTTEAPSQFKLVQTPESQYRVPEYSRVTTPQDPFRQIINQYEIEQINSQFGLGKDGNPETVQTTTPAPVSTQKYYETPSTTVRSRSRSRHRGRTTTTSTTPNPIVDENYTVLEEFAIHPKTSTPKYTTEVETIPAKVYKLEPQPPPVYQTPLKQPETSNEQFLRESITRPLKQQEQFLQESVQSRPQETLNQQFLQESVPSRQQVYNQQTPEQFLRESVQTRPNGDFGQQFLNTERPTAETERSIADIQDPRLTPVYSQNTQEQPNPYLPGLINNLQDQALRPLLVPNLLVPTTEKLTTIAPQPSTEEIRVITTTEAPRIETTTQRRNRGRQRAHTSRQQSSTSTPRRTVNRRRPNYTRPTTERQYSRTTTESTPSYEPTKRVSSQRQRFRTRGRPVQKEQAATERILQTTEAVFRQPPLEGGFQASSGDPQSYMQFDHVIDNQQVITIKPEQSSEESPFKEYHQVYSLPQQSPSTERVLEVSTTSKPVVDVKITHPVTERTHEPVIITTPSDDSRFIRVNSNIQSGGVIYNNKNDEVTRVPVRTRGRSRNRNRSTTPRPTTTTTTTTQKPQEEEDDEFYGFIRKPIYNKPAPVVYTTTQSLPLYSASYSQTPRTLIQLEEENQNQDYESGASSPPVQFVGQIRPKYTTETPEYPTEAPKSRSRARIRVPNRKVAPHQHQSYNEVKSQKLDDQVTRRSSVVRSRTRGKSHYKLPENLAVKSDEHDVEGGNYPTVYKNKELTTEKPSSFQITVDPAEGVDDDQVPHPSLYSPQIIRNTETQWVEASILPSPNQLEIEDKQMFVTSSEEQTTIPDEEIEEQPVEIETEEIPTTTETVETTSQRKKLARRRGVWKLVKHRPVDSIETAESQNYYAVVNGFEDIVKKNKDDVSSKSTTTTVSPTTKRRTTTTTTTESSIFETLYSMLGMASKASQLPKMKPKVVPQKEEITTTTASPTFPEEYTDEPTTQEIKQTEENHNEETTIVAQTTTTTTTPSPTTTKDYDVEPWEEQEVKTSTSTEISHETEICYKGKCIKSKDDKTRL